jgi:hypothetical protein
MFSGHTKILLIFMVEELSSSNIEKFYKNFQMFEEITNPSKRSFCEL